MPDLTLHAAIIKLAIAYTLLGAFIFTVVITLLSLIGLVEFKSSKQQGALFSALVLEIVALGVGVFKDFLNFDARKVQTEVTKPLVEQVSRIEAQRKQSEDRLRLILPLIREGHTIKRGDVQACQEFLRKSAELLRTIDHPKHAEVAVQANRTDPNTLADSVNSTVALLESIALEQVSQK
jgi:hypothetical protein